MKLLSNMNEFLKESLYIVQWDKTNLVLNPVLNLVLNPELGQIWC